MDDAAIARHLAAQAGVISRNQVLAAAGKRHDVERMIRRRVWARVHPGVYVDHTGPLSWKQQAWAAVLLHQPAVLAGRSALQAHGLAERTTDGVVEVAVAATRRVDDPPGVRTWRLRDFDRVAKLHVAPPRVSVEHAVLVVASGARTDDAAVAALGNAVQQRRTTAQRLLVELDQLGRLRRRGFLREVLGDVLDGAHSALERRYLRDVERAHGLPIGRRQLRAAPDRAVGARAAYRDVVYEDQLAVVELDGQLGHDTQEEKWDDLDRDVHAAATGLLPLRAGWRQVLDPCRLAMAIARILQARGWQGQPHPCGPGCPVALLADDGGSGAPDASDPPRSAA